MSNSTMPMPAGNAWLPPWLGVVGTAAFLLVFLVHVWHLRASSARVRAWHAGHVLMALGMIDMFVPGHAMPVPAVVGEGVFAVATVAVAGVAAWQAVRRTMSWLWLVSVVDLAAMVAMFVLHTTRFSGLTAFFVGWFVLQAAGWAFGWLVPMGCGTTHAGDRRGEANSSEGPASAAASTDTPATAGRPASTGVLSAPRVRPGVTSGEPHERSVRVTLTIMSLGMAYMFLAMQIGMPAM